MIDYGFIKLHRSMLNWEWYNDINTSRLFIHLILTANYEDKKWQGKTIKRGQRVTSVNKLALETKLSVRNIRTALEHLNSTNEVTNKSTRNYTLITVLNYEKYQEPTNEVTNDRQTTDKRPTNDRQTTDNNVRNKRNKRNKELKDISAKEAANADTDIKIKATNFTPPSIEEVVAYCQKRSNKVDAAKFIDFYQSKGWMVGKNKMKDWQACVRTWEKENGTAAIKQSGTAAQIKNYSERDYSDVDFNKFYKN